MFLVNLNMSVCYESSGACEVGPIYVFVNTLLPKTSCDFSSDFLVTGKQKSNQIDFRIIQQS